MKIRTMLAVAGSAAALALSVSSPAQAATTGTICNAMGTLSSSPIIWIASTYPGPLTAEGGIYHAQCRKGAQFVCTEVCTSPWGYRYPKLTKIAMTTTGVLTLH